MGTARLATDWTVRVSNPSGLRPPMSVQTGPAAPAASCGMDAVSLGATVAGAWC